MSAVRAAEYPATRITDTAGARVRIASVLAFVLSLATILGAWGFQLIGHYIPCALCLQQRIPYYVGVPVLAVASIVAFSGRSTVTVRWLLALGAIVFLVGAGLGVRHAGVEWGWWEGPANCGTTSAPALTNAGDLLNVLRNTHLVTCTEASWRFLGLSFAGWNAVISAAVAGIAAWGALTARPRHSGRW